MTTKSIASPPLSDPSHEPIWLLHLLSLFNCDSIPKILFSRASKSPVGWNNAGELVHLDFHCLHLLHPELEATLKDGQTPWSERYTSNESRKLAIEDLIESENAAVEGLTIFAKDTQLGILTLVVSAFPEPWCEIVWEDVESQLWEVVESTCLPLLGVLDGVDVKKFIESHLSHQRDAFVLALTKFLIRLSTILKSRTPPNLPPLMLQCRELLREYTMDENVVSRGDLQYICDSMSISEILINTNQPWVAAQKLLALPHGGNKRFNAAIGFALGSLPPSWVASASGQSLGWKLISAETPSTMELIAQSQLFGAISIMKLPGIRWERLPLETRVLVAFCEVKKKAFSNTVEILEKIITEVERKYGSKSLELLLTGTVLINCYNATGLEESGAKLAGYIWSNVLGTFSLDATVKTAQQAHLMIATADSFLGQGKYDEASRLLNGVLNQSIAGSSLVMSATLRLLKMSRRTKAPRTMLEDWNKLNNAVKNFDEISSILKYECIEEVVCLLSVLNPKDIAKTPQISAVVRILSNYRIGTYEGPAASRLNLHQNLEELQQLKDKLNLFSVEGPQLSFCRKLRERFLHASIQTIEKVGSANWQRFRRIMEVREMDEETETETKAQVLTHAKSSFHDSGLGSSLGSDPMQIDSAPQSARKIARSVTSIRSFMPSQDNEISLPAMPDETPNGERSCYICEKSINGVTSETQWKHHIFSDLRPYVCIVEACDADFMGFTSRVEFADHLSGHKNITLWACMQCGHEEERKQLIEDHIEYKHTSPQNGSSNIAISQKTVHRDLTSQNCPFCGDVPGSAKFVGHICHHLEEISLSAIPQNIETDDDIDRESTSGAPLPSRMETTASNLHEQVGIPDHLTRNSAGLMLEEALKQNSKRRKSPKPARMSSQGKRLPTAWSKWEWNDHWLQESRYRRIANTGNEASDFEWEYRRASLAMQKPPSKEGQPAPVGNEDRTTSVDPFNHVFKLHDSREFKFGRVFKILWTKPSGSTGSPITDTENAKFGQNILTNVRFRRFVIITPLLGHSICIPVLTYGGQGTLKKGVMAEDHCVIYTTSKPKTPSNEVITNTPIRMIPENTRENLHPASRMNYAKVYTVEHNVKVCFIGHISPKYEQQVILDYHRIHQLVPVQPYHDGTTKRVYPDPETSNVASAVSQYATFQNSSLVDSTYTQAPSWHKQVPGTASRTLNSIGQGPDDPGPYPYPGQPEASADEELHQYDPTLYEK